jgi:hypothetical protein
LTEKTYADGISVSAVENININLLKETIARLGKTENTRVICSDLVNEGELAVYSLEKMSTAYNGITLNKLILETRNMFQDGEERDAFMAKVALQGYEYNNYYDDFVYEINSFKRYRVCAEFPKLTPRDLPTAIRKAMYEISLVEIGAFEIKE